MKIKVISCVKYNLFSEWRFLKTRCHDLRKERKEIILETLQIYDFQILKYFMEVSIIYLLFWRLLSITETRAFVDVILWRRSLWISRWEKLNAWKTAIYDELLEKWSWRRNILTTNDSLYLTLYNIHIHVPRVVHKTREKKTKEKRNRKNVRKRYRRYDKSRVFYTISRARLSACKYASTYTHSLDGNSSKLVKRKKERERLAGNVPIDPNVLHGRIVSRYVSTVINAWNKVKKKRDQFFHRLSFIFVSLVSTNWKVFVSIGKKTR